MASIDFITLAAAKRRARLLVEQASIKGIDLSDYLKKDETLKLLKDKQDKINFTKPTSPKNQDFWLDSSVSPFELKVYSNNKWETIGGNSSISFDDWVTNTPYKKDDYAVYDNKLYQAIKYHTSSTKFNTDIKNWKLIIGCKTDQYFKELSNPDKTTYVMCGDKIISGVKKNTVVKTVTDPTTGNVSTVTIKTEQSPTFTFKETDIVTIDSTTGNTIHSIEKTLSGSDGADISTASGEKTTIITDPSGKEISNETEAVQYINGTTDAFMSLDDANNSLDLITDDLKWNPSRNSDSLMTEGDVDNMLDHITGGLGWK